MRSGLFSPQFASLESNRIDVLWTFSLKRCVGVGQGKNALICFDGADVPSRIAGQARVAGRMDVARADTMAGCEPGRSTGATATLESRLREGRGDFLGSQRRRQFGRAFGRFSRFDLRTREQFAFNELLEHAVIPSFVVAHGEVFGRRQHFLGPARIVQIPFPPCPESAIERDRKSTRLNSSHGYISYAVFCLKKKNII